MSVTVPVDWNAKIEIFRDRSSRLYHFRRVSGNNENEMPSQGYRRKYTAIARAVALNPDVPRERYIDRTRGGLRLQSALLHTLPSEADRG